MSLRATRCLRPFASLLCIATFAVGPARAQDSGIRTESLPTSAMLGYERVRLPGGEQMGLVGGSLLFDIGGNWGIGPAVYGAATGQRGGFFVGGVELQRRWELSDGLSLATGLYAGGGGGASAPAGGGLMLRPAVTLLKDLDRNLQAGISLSSVRFPSGHIESHQIGLVLAWRGDFRHYTGGQPGERVTSNQASGLGFDRMLATVGRYELSDGSGRRIGLLGARAERRTGWDGLTVGLEASAAASGDAAGYMEVLGSVGASTAPLADALPSWRVGVRVAAGLGGGGAVPTAGGALGKATAGTEWSPLPGWTVGAEVGVIRSASGPLRARHAQVWIGLDLEPGLDGRSDPTGPVIRTEWVGSLQHHVRSQRQDGTHAALDTIGLKLNRYVGDNLYLSGQAHSAFNGGAGAYSIGIVGMGVATTPAQPQRFGAELLVGAAGGGGVSTAGGRVTQALAWGGWTQSPQSEWRLGLGSLHSQRGGLNSPVLELSWSRAFGMAGR